WRSPGRRRARTSPSCSPALRTSTSCAPPRVPSISRLVIRGSVCPCRTRRNDPARHLLINNVREWSMHEMQAQEARYRSVLERIARMHEPYARHRHPLWHGLMHGGFSKAQVAEWLRQFSIIPLYNHLYHGPLYVICPDPAWREMIAEV